MGDVSDTELILDPGERARQRWLAKGGSHVDARRSDRLSAAGCARVRPGGADLRRVTAPMEWGRVGAAPAADARSRPGARSSRWAPGRAAASNSILLLEHVRSRGAVLGWLADVASVVTRRVFGFNANRRTEENVLSAGLDIEDVRRDGSGERSSPGRGMARGPASRPRHLLRRDEVLYPDGPNGPDWSSWPTGR